LARPLIVIGAVSVCVLRHRAGRALHGTAPRARCGGRWGAGRDGSPGAACGPRPHGGASLFVCGCYQRARRCAGAARAQGGKRSGPWGASNRDPHRFPSCVQPDEQRNTPQPDVS